MTQNSQNFYNHIIAQPQCNNMNPATVALNSKAVKIGQSKDKRAFLKLLAGFILTLSVNVTQTFYKEINKIK